MLTDTQMFVLIQKIQHEQFDVVYSVLAMPTKTAIRGLKDGDFYVWNIYRDGRVLREKVQ